MFIKPFNEDGEGIGTGFMGVEFTSIEDVKKAILKYACNSKGEYKGEYIEFSFCLNSTMDAAKAEGDRQAKENGIVNLFEVCSMMRIDPFKNIKIFYRPGKWIDDNGKEFAFVIDKNHEAVPFYGRFRDALKEIGITLS